MVVNGVYGQCDENNADDNDHAPCSMGICECDPAEDKESCANAPHRDESSRGDRRIPAEGDSRVGVGPNCADQGRDEEHGSHGSHDCRNPPKHIHAANHTDAALRIFQLGLLWLLNLPLLVSEHALAS
ncbi:hypothetical protein QMK22_15485 [Cryobacterium sp. PH29-G1]|nr:hypothetical protein [Cryobacterium sp. PH29-G1]